MRVAVVTPPAPLLTLEQAKTHLRVDGADEDGYISDLISVAQSTIDGPAGWLGRSLGVQTLEAAGEALQGYSGAAGTLGGVGDDFYAGTYSFVGQQLFSSRGSGAIRLPCPPLMSVTSVKYTDVDGVEQTVDPGTYSVDPTLGVLRPVYGKQWPSAGGFTDGARIRYVAGYEAVPPAIIHALKVMIGLLFENRTTPASLETHATVASLLAPFRVWGSSRG